MLLSLHVYQQNYVTKNTDGVYFVITAYILNYNYIIFSNNNSCMGLSLEFYLFHCRRLLNFHIQENVYLFVYALQAMRFRDPILASCIHVHII